MKLDNIIPGPWNKWDPPYHFVVGRRVLWDHSSVQPIDVVNNPVIAYALYKSHKENDKFTAREILWEWFLTDSFGKDAIDFCRQKYEEYNAAVPEAEKKV